MTIEETQPVENDIYDQVMSQIDAGKDNHAVEMIMAQNGRSAQMAIISRLARDLDPVLDIKGASTLDMNRARALLRAREAAADLANNLDLNHAHALETAFDRARALYLYLDRATQINRVIIDCLKIMDRGDQSSTSMRAVTKLHRKPGTSQSKRGKGMWIAVVVIILLIAAATFMMLQARNNNAAASTPITVTVDSTSTK